MMSQSISEYCEHGRTGDFTKTATPGGVTGAFASWSTKQVFLKGLKGHLAPVGLGSSKPPGVFN